MTTADRFPEIHRTAGKLRVGCLLCCGKNEEIAWLVAEVIRLREIAAAFEESPTHALRAVTAPKDFDQGWNGALEASAVVVQRVLSEAMRVNLSPYAARDRAVAAVRCLEHVPALPPALPPAPKLIPPDMWEGMT